VRLSTKITVVIAVLVAGICAALPFKRPASTQPQTSQAERQRQQTFHSHGSITPLRISSGESALPAFSSAKADNRGTPLSRPALCAPPAMREPKSLDDLVPPPSLPEQDATETTPSSTRQNPLPRARDLEKINHKPQSPKRAGKKSSSPKRPGTIRKPRIARKPVHSSRSRSKSRSAHQTATGKTGKPNTQPHGVAKANRAKNTKPSSATEAPKLTPIRRSTRGHSTRPHSTRLRRHTIVDGDDLRHLAKRYLGSPDRYMEIYQRNRNVLPDPALLPIGAELVIPGR